MMLRAGAAFTLEGGMHTHLGASSLDGAGDKVMVDVHSLLHTWLVDEQRDEWMLR
jgi:hypothetical protein